MELYFAELGNSVLFSSYLRFSSRPDAAPSRRRELIARVFGDSGYYGYKETGSRSRIVRPPGKDKAALQSVPICRILAFIVHSHANPGPPGRLVTLLTPKLRSAEYADFHRWFREKNARRTRLVGLVLLPFAVFASVMALFGLVPDTGTIYPAFLITTAIGAWVITVGLRAHRLKLSYLGELVVLSTAITWMFVAVAGRLDVGFGLAEFVIGTLGLALLRGMKPRTTAIAFPALAVGYAGILALSGSFDLQAAMNGLVFCVFALVWSLAAFNSQITLYRNTQLLAELNRQNAQLAAIAVQDPLTGLPNRRYFDQALEQRWSDASRSDAPVVLILLDIDNFKRYNDVHGHPRGDACLQRVGRLLTAGLGTAGLCIRFGGEEFATILTTGTLDGGVVVATRLLERVRKDGEVTISAGVAVMTPRNGTPEELYAVADRALYRAKESGRDQVATGDQDDART